MEQNVEIAHPIQGTPKGGFAEKDYKFGRVPIHPLLNRKRQRFFCYGETFTFSGTKLTGIIQLDNDSHFLLEAIQVYIQGEATLDADSHLGLYNLLTTINITDLSKGKALINASLTGTQAPTFGNAAGAPIHDVTGYGCNPKYLDDPTLFDPNTILQFNVTGPTAATGFDGTKVYVQLIGRKVYSVTDQESFMMQKRQWHCYAIDVAQLNGSSALQIYTVQIFNEADFLLRKINSCMLNYYSTSFSSSGSGLEPLLNIRATALNRSIFSTLLDGRLNFGANIGTVDTQTLTGPTYVTDWSFSEDGRLKKPFLIPRNSMIEMRIMNPNAVNVDVHLPFVFEGIHIFD